MESPESIFRKSLQEMSAHDLIQKHRQICQDISSKSIEEQVSTEFLIRIVEKEMAQRMLPRGFNSAYDPDKEYITAPQISEILGISIKSVYRWFKEEKLKPIHIHNRIVVDLDQVNELKRDMDTIVRIKNKTKGED